MFDDMMSARFWLALAEIAGINILLSGDNAVVIALASRGLPAEQRRIAVLGGSAGAIVLRIVFSFVVVWLLSVPYLKLFGGALLLWIGVKLIVPEEGGHGGVAAKSSLWAAIQTIVIADAVMSLDNVVAIAAAADGDMVLIVLGLLMSIPLIVFGSQLVLKVLIRYPLLVTFGGGLLGWIAGDIIAGDPAVQGWIPIDPHLLERIAKPLLCAFVVLTGTLLARRAARRPKEIVDLAPERPL